jgi:hypothetical protein
MFFILAKILGFFSMPSNVLMSLGIIGVVLMATRFAQAGRRLAVMALILLGVDRDHLARRFARHRRVAGTRRGRAE